jgi:hypothetical protein
LFISFQKLFLFINCYECPKPEILKPCTCDTIYGIQCDGEKEIDLNTIFKNLSQTLEKEKKHFLGFTLNNTAITELTENTFGEITFNYISIQKASNMTKIHTNAFNGTEKEIVVFTVRETPIKNSPPDHDVFKMFDSMEKLQYLTITHTEIDEIPENAFNPINNQMKNFSLIHMPDNKISKIGKNAFNNLDLGQLTLTGNPLSYISQNEFKFKTFNNRFDLYLAKCSLNSSSFESGAFGDINRPTFLWFESAVEIDNNNITYLDQHIFEPFLIQNQENRILLSTIDCNDCRSFWLHNNKKYINQSVYLKCSDGKMFAEKENFAKCSELL